MKPIYKSTITVVLHSDALIALDRGLASLAEEITNGYSIGNFAQNSSPPTTENTSGASSLNGPLSTSRERTTMITPTVHLNGSSRETLADGYRDAYSALNAAMPALIATHPNARDYYPAGPQAIRQAINPQRARRFAGALSSC